MTSLFRPVFLFGRPTAPAPTQPTPGLLAGFRAPLPPVAPPPPPPPPPPVPAPPLPSFLRRDTWTPSAPTPAATPTPAAAQAIDGQAPDPRALHEAIQGYRTALLERDRATASTTNMIFSGLTGTGNRAIMLLQGDMAPHSIRLLSLAWLGREATPAELARYDQILKTNGREGLSLISAEIGSKGLVARLRRTDGSPAAIEAIHRQAAAMLTWGAGDTPFSNSATVRPIPPGPALDPIRTGVSSPVVGTPNADRANSPAAMAAMKQAIVDYGKAINVPGVSEMTWILSGNLVPGGPVYLLPGLMVPHGARMMMLAWLGREPNAEELTRWTGWYAGQDGRDARKAFGDVMADIERIGLAARLPETDGSPEAVAALRKQVAAKFRWP